MNGAEHYREAERLLALAEAATADDAYAAMPLPDPPRLPYIVAAQVHATLAQAAATALNDGYGGMNGDTRREWLTATRPAGGER